MKTCFHVPINIAITIILLSALLLCVARESEAFERTYKVEDVLGTGGFGVVYAGTRRDDGTPVRLPRLLLLLSKTE